MPFIAALAAATLAATKASICAAFLLAASGEQLDNNPCMCVVIIVSKNPCTSSTEQPIGAQERVRAKRRREAAASARICPQFENPSRIPSAECVPVA
jgi:hypothetical protein